MHHEVLKNRRLVEASHELRSRLQKAVKQSQATRASLSLRRIHCDAINAELGAHEFGHLLICRCCGNLYSTLRAFCG